MNNKKLDLKLPVDTLVDIDSNTKRGRNLYHIAKFVGDTVYVFNDGKSSHTGYMNQVFFRNEDIKNIKILENPWMVHHGGECPVSDWVNLEALSRDGDILSVKAGWYNNQWNHVFDCDDIIAYRILEQEIPNE
jgi:hypothetical protein